jgi:diadenosine tetraphosphatase ApaH/serine/threonine PP2A family protein phosphatase
MRIAVLSDVHSNLEALRAVLDALPSVDRLLCLGDIVGYGADPAPVIDLLRERGAEAVQGNHDWAVVTGKTEWFNPWAARAVEWTRSALDRGPVEWLRRLPRTLEMPEQDLLAVHGSPSDPLFEYVVDSASASDSFRATARRTLLLGHSHVAMRFALREQGLEWRGFPEGGAETLPPRVLLNPGSVGQPRDGNPKASFALLDAERFEVRRVEYDVAMAARKIREAGLPEFLAQRLLRGT